MGTLGGFEIPVKGLEAGNHSFKFDVDGEFFKRFEDSPVQEGRAAVAVEARETGSGLDLHFRIEGEAEVLCDRCLEPMMQPVEYDGTLAVRVSDQAAGEYDGDTLWIASRDETVDVAQYVYESICLGLPLTRIHGTDRNGVPACDPDMLKRFRIVSPQEFDRMAEEKNERNPLKVQLEKIMDEENKTPNNK